MAANGGGMRYWKALTALGLFLAPVQADDLRLWVVQAVDTGTEKVCDAFAKGAYNRPLYEFRFRRARDYLYLIVSYDGPKVVAEKGDADILFNGRHMVAPATAISFGNRNAFVISIKPQGFDFHQFDATVPLSVSFGSEKFDVSFKADDEVGSNMDACMRAMKIE